MQLGDLRRTIKILDELGASDDLEIRAFSEGGWRLVEIDFDLELGHVDNKDKYSDSSIGADQCVIMYGLRV